MTNDWQQVKRAALTRNFQQISLDNIIATAVGMFHQGNIQALETQHQLVHDLPPNDLVNRGVIHSSNPDTPGPTRPFPPHIPASPRLIITGHRDPGNRTPHQGIAHRNRAASPPPSAPCKTRPFPGPIRPSQGVIGPPSSGPSQGA